MSGQKHIAITGAGLVGCLLAVYLCRRGYKVTVFERRPDLRQQQVDAGRSINLALSNRGLRALEEIGLADDIIRIAIPMHKRMIHALDGSLTFQPYGKQGQFINSISRSNLNILLLETAEKQGATFHFSHRVTEVDLMATTLTVQQNGVTADNTFDAIVGADGAFSAVRHAMQFTDQFNFSQDYIEHAYKEFHIPATPNGQFAMEKNALHIWPRESYMLIALPNPDGSFTCTLFFPFDGDPSFSSLRTEQNIRHFFLSNFPDATALMPRLIHDFNSNPTSSLVTMKCFPWVRNKTLLIGDAAHAIVPFYGQGMNAGFEDCRILNQLMDQHQDDWEKTIQAFQLQRKPDTDAIAQLALDNFIEMRDLVADADFLLRKKIEAKLHELYPEEWIPLYSMVTFYDNIRYSEAYRIGLKQKKIMDEVMKKRGIETTWMRLDFEQLVRQLQAT
ncbi:NAD(P)/FAD-dependent oxidoreductase [Chryseolinea sp. H1M3-3]|uniref:FAD-dependent oxidoreductase n=1 Tax=Chryseolinea sp. H1M3-3 TaxID=3034144 RepID=UPI0023EDB02A|nr:NAD(P)/FAD-dependent oxidoreductase [Chryseolinea sp. H1M3-3]